MPASPRIYKVKQKNAQEAHEAIRPTDITRTPNTLKNMLSIEQFKLYELIWKRTVASQMESAQLDLTAFVIESGAHTGILRATGTVVRFPGFLAIYQEGRDDSEDEESRQLPAIDKGAKLDALEVKPEQHFTEPPPRYSEASLVKRLEELGIGRPSTYAAILGVLQDRQYVILDKKRFIPEARGRIVNAFLVSFFKRYVEYDFTANLEDRLDKISAGELDWKTVLAEWWADFSQAVGEAKELRTTQVLDEMDQLLGAYIFGLPKENADGQMHDPRTCPACQKGKLSLKLGKFGAFVGCSNYPECNYTRQLSNDAGANAEAADEANSLGGDGPRELGSDPKTGLTVWLKKGPYGWYVQLGEAAAKPTEKPAKGAKVEKPPAPKRASLAKGQPPESVTLDAALHLLALPREVGVHPETKEIILAAIGRFGPYLLHNKKYTNLRGDDDVYTIGINRAVDILADAAQNQGTRRGFEPERVLGNHPEGGEVALYKGRYGPYVQHNGIRANLPKDVEPNQFELDEAIVILAERAAKPSTGKKPFRKGAVAKKAPARKTSASKPAAAKKPAAKKPTVKKIAAKKTAAKKKAV